MKNLFALLTVFSLSVFSATAQLTSNIIIFSEDASLFYVYLNGVMQNQTAQSNVKITGLTNPANQLLIVFPDERKGKLTKNIFFDPMGVEATAKITYTKKGYKLRYFGEVPIGSNPNNPNQWTQVYSSTTTNTPTNSNTTISTSSSTTTTTTNTTISTIGNSSTVPSNTNVQSDNLNSASGNSINSISSNNVTNTTAASISAVDMNYLWSKGASYVFQTTQTDDINTSMMGMNLKDRFTTTSEFVLFIETINSNGTASGWLYLIDYKVTDSRGSILANINDLPAQAVRSIVQVDRKGHFSFEKELTLITSSQGNVLAYVTPNSNGLSIGGQAGEITVDAYAEFDPKTGMLKANYKTNTIKDTRPVSIKLNEEADMIKVLPYEYLELLALPEGAVAQGDLVTVRSGIYTTNIEVTSVNNGTARINYAMKTDKSQDPATSKVTGSNTQSGGNFGMDTQAMGMPTMGSMDPDAANMMNSMSPDMSCNINSDFSYALGMFNSVSGTVTTVMDTMGLKMTVVSNLTMKKL